MDKIPLTTSGKVDRKALPAPGMKTGKNGAVPRDGIEKKLAGIWREVLDLHTTVGSKDNFFELGGHSLKATILTAKIHKVLNVKVPLEEIFKNQTIEKLADYIKNLAEDIYASLEAVEKKEYYALSSAQKRIYFLQQMNINSIAYNIPLVLSLDREVEINKLVIRPKKRKLKQQSLIYTANKISDASHFFTERRFVKISLLSIIS